MPGTTLSLLYSFPLRVGRTGIGNTAFQQVLHLSKFDINITLVCGSNEKELPENVQVVESLKVFNTKIPIRLLGIKNANALHDYKVISVLNNMPFDIAHFWCSASAKPIHAANSRGIKTFLERQNSHTTFAAEVVAREYNKLNLPIARSNTHYVSKKRMHSEESQFRASNYLLCPSDFVKQSFIVKGYEEHKLLRHHYGFDQQRPVTSGVINSDDRFRAIFVGRIEPRKGLHYALDAWLQADAHKNGGEFIIVGNGEDAYKQFLLQRYSHPSIKYLGFRNDIPELMASSQCFILSSVEEGSALVTYEASACGNVVLASTSTGAEINHGIDGLLHDVGSVEQLRDHINLVFHDRNVLETLRKKSKSRSKNFTWESAAEILFNHYRTAMA